MTYGRTGVKEDKEVRKDRHSWDPKSSVNAPAKKDGGGGRYTMGKPEEDHFGAGRVDYEDPNFDAEEKRIDPDDGAAYTWDELSVYYGGKFKKKALADYWENECTKAPPKKRKAKKAEDVAPVTQGGPKPGESVQYVKVKVKAPKAKPTKPSLTDEERSKGDQSLAQEIADLLPYYPFKKIERFYDIQGLLMAPKLLNKICAVMAKRYRKQGVTKILAFEARGFLFTPIAIKLGVPFIMARKAGKMPNTISSAPYAKEYEGVDTICIQKDSIEEGDKVVLIDDLIATGGTLCAGIELVKACKAKVVECSCLVELKGMKGREKVLKAGAQSLWSFIDEDLLTTKAELPADYVDDGKK